MARREVARALRVWAHQAWGQLGLVAEVDGLVRAGQLVDAGQRLPWNGNAIGSAARPGAGIESWMPIPAGLNMIAVFRCLERRPTHAEKPAPAAARGARRSRCRGVVVYPAG